MYLLLKSPCLLIVTAAIVNLRHLLLCVLSCKLPQLINDSNRPFLTNRLEFRFLSDLPDASAVDRAVPVVAS